MDAVEGLRQRYQTIGRHLSERHRRLWAATEAQALGHGGISLVAHATGLSIRTIKRGLRELAGRRCQWIAGVYLPFSAGHQ